MKKIINKIKIWYWWYFIINQNEFHPSMNSIEIDNMDKIYTQRQVAHLLSIGEKIHKLPDHLIDQFSI